MEWDYKTARNFNTVTAGLTVSQLLGPNPYRHALLLSPVANQAGSAQAVTAVVFNAGTGQTLTVPADVTSFLDGYMWGSGGSSSASGAVLGGGGGGGGGFSTLGQQTVIPGSIWAIAVGSGGGTQNTRITSPDASVDSLANFGTTPVLDAAGVGGAAGIGATTFHGGNGAAATALAGVGGGSGGSGGAGVNGHNAAGATGGTAAGMVGFGGYGVGGAGVNGQAIGVNGLTGGSPGAGGSGGGKTGGAVGAGADGLAVIFYATPDTGLGITIDQDPNVLLAKGAINFLPGKTAPYLLRRYDLGNAIMDPWFVISGLAGQVVRVTEYSYVSD